MFEEMSVVDVLRDSNETKAYANDFITDWKFSHHVYDENLTQAQCEQIMIEMCADIANWIELAKGVI